MSAHRQRNKGRRQLDRLLAALAEHVRTEALTADSERARAAVSVVCTEKMLGITRSEDGDSVLSSTTIAAVRGLFDGEEASLAMDALRVRHGTPHPSLYLDEHLESSLDTDARITRGGYASPWPVASFIARAARDALDSHCALSLSDARVLDPSCGTGALLLAVRELTPSVRLAGIERSLSARSVARLHLPDATLVDGDALDAGNSAANALFSERGPVVIVANPPFGAADAQTPWTSALMRGGDADDPRSYRREGRENNRWIHDRCLHFLRAAQWCAARSERAVVVMALSHAMVEHRSFEAVRASLREVFSLVRVVDLHGASRHGLKTPDGARDENVFEIQQGVCVLVLARSPERSSSIERADLWGTRAEKFAALSANALSFEAVNTSLNTAPWTTDARREDRAWDEAIALDACFDEHGPAIVTGNDRRAVAFTRDEAIALARERSLDEDSARPWLYRPFDVRWAVDHDDVLTRPRRKTMAPLYEEGALAIIARRQCPPELPYTWTFASALPVCDGVLRTDPHGVEAVFSLYRSERGARVSNISREALARMSVALGREVSAEALFAYAYGLLHVRAFRERFARQMSADFPRVLLSRDEARFEFVRARGQRLLSLHTSPSLAAERVRFVGAPGAVGDVSYASGSVQIACGAFAPVPLALWEFCVGRRQVARKWLEDRASRGLSDADLRAYTQALDALLATLDVMAELDEISDKSLDSW